MAKTQKPTVKPQNPCFSSGPCAKRPGWAVAKLDTPFAGRSHRAKEAKATLKHTIDQQKALLGIPQNYYVGIVPASDTGAVEMAMWSLLGPRGVDVLAWEAFSSTWLKDITDQLKLQDVRLFESPYGTLPDLSAVDTKTRDVVFVWNGTTSGVRVPDGDWIATDREGLTICDATSAVFAYDMPWDKLDVITWSWQKVLGGEAAHGMIALSPRAVERLESYTPSWPMPKIFRMTKGGKLNVDIFEGSTINTPSMLAVADCLDALNWVEQIGGQKATIQRVKSNFDAVKNWVDNTPNVEFLAGTPAHRSYTSVCVRFTDSWITAFDNDMHMNIIKEICALLDQEGAGYDIKSYKSAPPGLRIWCGATVETSDVEALLPWIDWAYETVKNAHATKAA